MSELNEVTRINRPRSRRGVTLILLIIALVAAAAVFALRGGFTDQNSASAITGNVGQHIILPDEEPTVTTVEKASELSAQAFFSSVKDGDKILIYPKSARIIIYRPSENILVNVGPIVDDSTTATDDSINDTTTKE